MKKCPYCAEEIQDEAVKCRFCGEFLAKAAKEKWYFKPVSLFILFLCVGPFMLPLVWLNPRLNKQVKLIISLVVVVITFFLVVFLVDALKNIISYYRQVFGQW